MITSVSLSRVIQCVTQLLKFRNTISFFVLFCFNVFWADFDWLVFITNKMSLFHKAQTIGEKLGSSISAHSKEFGSTFTQQVESFSDRISTSSIAKNIHIGDLTNPVEIRVGSYNVVVKQRLAEGLHSPLLP